MKSVMKEKNHKNGMTIALIAMILGIVIWVIVWRSGLKNATLLVALAIIFGVFRGYEYGAGKLGREQLSILAIWAIAGIALAFFSGVVSNVWVQYRSQDGGTQGFLSLEFWTHVAKYLSETATYLKDLIWTVVVTILGLVSLRYDLKRSQLTEKAKKVEKVEK